MAAYDTTKMPEGDRTHDDVTYLRDLSNKWSKNLCRTIRHSHMTEIGLILAGLKTIDDKLDTLLAQQTPAVRSSDVGEA